MTNLRIPGPTPCPPDVLEALGRQMINHRGPEFSALLQRVTAGLRPFFATQNDLLLLTSSGTGAMEAAAVNTLSPGDAVLAVSIGAFGDRFATIAETYGAAVTRLDFEWGSAADPAVVRDALQGGDFRAVLLTHNETSTGVTNPMAELCDAVRSASDALIVVDAVSSLACIPFETDAWGVDLVVTGSQKGWQVPPGLAMAAVGPRAWAAYEQARMPRFYFDLGKARDLAAKGQTPATPALPILFALDASLRTMTAEGPAAIYARHAELGARARAGVQALGLELFADPRFASNTVTAIRVPAGLDGKEWVRVLRENHDTVVAGGQAKLAGQIIRLGHLGWVEADAIDAALAAIGAAFTDLSSGEPVGARA